MGFGHWLNERRQIIKFYKDIYYHNLYCRFNHDIDLPYDKSGTIPKTIHYAWFGKGQKPELVEKCLATWPTVLKDYNIILWDEGSFPIEKYRFAKQAYDKKKYAYVADVARLHALYYYGGIYMDTDCEVLKPFDDLLSDEAFMCYETPNLISSGTIGAKKHHPWIAMMLKWYECVEFCDDYAEIAITRICTRMSRLKYGIKPNGKLLILSDGVKVYPRDYFCPDKVDGKWDVSGNTYVVHHFTGLW